MSNLPNFIENYYNTHIQRYTEENTGDSSDDSNSEQSFLNPTAHNHHRTNDKTII